MSQNRSTYATQRIPKIIVALSRSIILLLLILDLILLFYTPLKVFKIVGQVILKEAGQTGVKLTKIG